MAELMLAVNNFTSSYAKCLCSASEDHQKLPGERPAEEHGLSSEDVVRMQRELSNVTRDLKVLEESHGENVLKLVLAVGYLRTLMANSRVSRYLGQHHTSISAEFQKILESPELEG